MFNIEYSSLKKLWNVLFVVMSVWNRTINCKLS